MELHEVFTNLTNELIKTANIELSSEELNKLPQDTQMAIRVHNLELSTYLNNLSIQSILEVLSKTKYFDKNEYQTVLLTTLINNRNILEVFANNGKCMRNSISLNNPNDSGELITNVSQDSFESTGDIIKSNDFNESQ